MATMQLVAAKSESPEDALLCIRRWLNGGQMQEVDAELTRQYQLA